MRYVLCSANGNLQQYFIQKNLACIASTFLVHSGSSHVSFTRVCAALQAHSLYDLRRACVFGIDVVTISCALHRVCMVNNDGGVLLDQYVRPAEKVTDYRTFVSGIEPAHLKEGAVSLAEAQMQVAQILTNRILVGHAVHHDLQVD